MAKIGIISAQYLPHIGGVERYTYSLAKALKSMGHEPVIITSGKGTAAVEEWPVYRLDSFQFMNGRLPVLKLNKSLRRLKNQLEAEKLEAVIVNTRFYPLSVWGVQFASKEHVPFLLIEHGSNHLTLGNVLADSVIQCYEHMVTSIIKKSAPEFYAVSAKSLQWLAHFRIEGKGILSNAVDLEELKKYEPRYPYDNKTDRFIVLFAGRLAAGKGVVELCQAMRLLEDLNIELWVVGDGPLREELKSSGSPNILFLGQQPYEKTIEFNKSADALCLPSESEGFATVLLEAAACHTYIISTDVGGAREVLAEGNGTILKSNSPEEIADAIRYAYSHRDAIKNSADTICTKVQNEFNWKKTAAAALNALSIHSNAAS